MGDRLTRRKILLVCLIAATSAAPAFFIRLNESSFNLNLWKLLAKIGSLCGTMLIFWQFLLGYRQAAARWVTPDYLWLIRLHRWVGILIGLLILLHPVFLTPYYLEKKGILLFSLGLSWPLSLFVPLGIAALAILLYLVISSVYLREKMEKDTWYLTHLGSYILLPLAFIHAYPIGMTLGGTGLRYVWQGLFAAAAILYIWRILARLGVFSAIYRVVGVRKVAENVTDIAMRPVRGRLRPRAAQFAFFRRCRTCPARPFTISKYDSESGEICITVKAAGRETSRFQKVKAQDPMLVDGPYGIFGREVFNTQRPVVMLAGGIGITPFRRIIGELAGMPGREAYLFWGNRLEKDIALRGEIEEAGHVEVVHVLSGVETHEELETGYVDLDLLKRRLGPDLSRFEFFICGPPPMIRKLEADLLAAGIPEARIHHELFSY